MKPYQKAFIEFALKHQALCFGEFTLKSGRISPYFYNARLFNDGASLAQLGQFYAETIVDADIDFDLLFGPAYAGIPIVCATAMALAEKFKRPTRYCFNRKEIKTHGEGGQIVGAKLEGKALIVDDVITAGTAFRESLAFIQQAQAQPAGLVVSLDRQEKSQDNRSAIQSIEQDCAIPVICITKIEDVLNYLNQAGQAAQIKAIEAYLADYGC